MRVPSVTREIIIIRRGYPNTKHKFFHMESAILNFCDDASLSKVFRLKQSLSRIISTQRIISYYVTFSVIYVETQHICTNSIYAGTEWLELCQN